LRLLLQLRLLSIYQRLEGFIEKITVAEEVFVNFYNFNPIREKHTSIQVKKIIFKVFIQNIGNRDRSRSRKEIFSAPQHYTKIISSRVPFQVLNLEIPYRSNIYMFIKKSEKRFPKN
jgi:hypothetical protein